MLFIVDLFVDLPDNEVLYMYVIFIAMDVCTFFIATWMEPFWS